MDENLTQYLDGLFAPYEDTRAIKDLKEELLHDLKEKYRDYKNQGYDDETGTGLAPVSQAIAGAVSKLDLTLLFLLAGGLTVLLALWTAFQPGLTEFGESLSAAGSLEDPNLPPAR